MANLENKGYEWIGDADKSIEAPANENSAKYYEPNRDYDTEFSPTKEDIKTVWGVGEHAWRPPDGGGRGLSVCVL